MIKMSKYILALTLSVMLAGCKLVAEVPIGGSVSSASGVRNCPEVSTCNFEINDSNFTETFTAIPKLGYKFLKWKSGSNRVCPGSTNPICVASNTAFAGVPEAEAIIASNAVYTIEPIFAPLIGELTEIVDELASSADGLAVYDVNDTIVGNFISTDGGYAWVRYDYEFEGANEFAILRVARTGFYSQIEFGTSRILYDNSNCTGDPVTGSVGWIQGNIHTTVFIFAQDDLDPDGISELYKVGDAVSDFDAVAQRLAYDSGMGTGIGECHLSTAGSIDSGYQLKYVENLYDKFTPPFSVR